MIIQKDLFGNDEVLQIPEVKREEVKIKMFTTSKNKQLTIFGDNGIYNHMLNSPKIQDNPLIKLKPIIDEAIKEVEPELEKYYCLDFGRPSWPVGTLLKTILLEYLYNTSDVSISRTSHHDFLFRWFIDVDVMDETPDDSTLVVFRKRLKKEGFQKVFDTLIKVSKKFGYKKGTLRVFDATHIFSDTPSLGPITLIKDGMKRIINRIKRIDKSVGEKLMNKYKQSINILHRGKEGLKNIREKATKFIKDVKYEIKKKVVSIQRTVNKSIKKPIEDVNNFLKILKEIINGNKKLRSSFIDLDARWGRKAKDFLFSGYKLHIGYEHKSRQAGLVTSVEVFPANEIEGPKLPEAIKREQKIGLKIKEVHLDRIYDTKNNREFLRKNGIEAFIPARSKKIEVDKFEVEDERIKCSDGKYAIGRVRQGDGWIYYFSRSDCRNCKLKDKCLKPYEVRKRVYFSEVKKMRLESKKEKWKVRRQVEKVVGWAKRWYGLGRARYRSLWKVSQQALMTFICWNLKAISTVRAP